MTTAKQHVWASVAGCLGLLATPGCSKVCEDDGFVWQQVDTAACMAASATEGASDSASDTAPTTNVPTGGSGTWCADKDMDGFGDPGDCQDSQFPGSAPNDGDCADDNANAFPGAAEKESADACMEDVDEDGYGDDMPPPGVMPGTDCNDDNGAIFPDAAPKDLPGMCAQDGDGDGYGDNMPDDPGVPAGTDCNDTDPNTFPGAAPKDNPTACMTDADMDDWGDSSPTAPGAVPGSDCNDGDAAVHDTCIACTANEAKCVGDELHVCNAQGNADQITICEFGCNDATPACWDALTVNVGDAVCIDQGKTIQLSAMTTGGDGMYAWSWTPAADLDDPKIQDPTATPLGPTTYIVDVNDGEGNKASDSVTVYLKNQALSLDPKLCTAFTYTGEGEDDDPPSWTWDDKTKELCQTINAKGSALFCGWELNHAKINGNFVVKAMEDNDWLGFMWGIQDTDHFYLFSWKQGTQTFDDCGGDVPKGMQVKMVSVVDPKVSPHTCADRHHPGDTVNSKLLVSADDFYDEGWVDFIEYTFELIHLNTGEITITVHEKGTNKLVATKTFMDTTYLSGKFGMYTKSQINSCFSQFSATCI